MSKRKARYSGFFGGFTGFSEVFVQYVSDCEQNPLNNLNQLKSGFRIQHEIRNISMCDLISKCQTMFPGVRLGLHITHGRLTFNSMRIQIFKNFKLLFYAEFEYYISFILIQRFKMFVNPPENLFKNAQKPKNPRKPEKPWFLYKNPGFSGLWQVTKESISPFLTRLIVHFQK